MIKLIENLNQLIYLLGNFNAQETYKFHVYTNHCHMIFIGGVPSFKILETSFNPFAAEFLSVGGK